MRLSDIKSELLSNSTIQKIMKTLEVDDINIKTISKDEIYNLSKLQIQNPIKPQVGDVFSPIGTLMMIEMGTPLLITMYKEGEESSKGAVEDEGEGEKEEGDEEKEKEDIMRYRLELPMDVGEKEETKREYSFRIFYRQLIKEGTLKSKL